ncbi:MAG: hypothetical protein WCF95_03545 [bacterium]
MQIQRISRGNTQPPSNPQPAFKGIYILKSTPEATPALMTVYDSFSKFASESYQLVNPDQSSLFGLNFKRGVEDLEQSFSTLLNKVLPTCPPESVQIGVVMREMNPQGMYTMGQLGKMEEAKSSLLEVITQMTKPRNPIGFMAIEQRRTAQKLAEETQKRFDEEALEIANQKLAKKADRLAKKQGK